jgi:uncharacterized repeat protein (TIGR03803 family)
MGRVDAQGAPVVRSLARVTALLLLSGAAAALPSPEQAFTIVARFNGSNGAVPYAQLIQGTDGNLYGATERGGQENDKNYGTVFSVTPDGVITLLHSFRVSDGAYPDGGLVQSTDGSLFGTTTRGGMTWGTIFRIPPGGPLTTLYSFGDTDGEYPAASLVEGSDANLYGTSVRGGRVLARSSASRRMAHSPPCTNLSRPTVVTPMA